MARAQDPERFAALCDLLRLWRLHAIALSKPGYAERLAAAAAGSDADVSLEEIIAGRTLRPIGSASAAARRCSSTRCPRLARTR